MDDTNHLSSSPPETIVGSRKNQQITSITSPQEWLRQDVIFYDGTCVLCHRFVRWTLKRDSRRTLRYAPLSGRTAERFLPANLREKPGSVVFVNQPGELYLEAPAVWQVCRRLRAPWNSLWYLIYVPNWLSNIGYRLLARNRYRIFGRYNECRLPLDSGYSPSCREKDLNLFLP